VRAVAVAASLVVASLVAAAGPARAQAPDTTAAVRGAPAAAPLPGRRAAERAPTVVPEGAGVPIWRRPWVRPLASLLFPGSGQLLAHRDRGAVYLAVEVWFVARALAWGQQGRLLRSQFQTLAFDVARRPFTPTRIDGPWDYYETMSHFVESGAYNASTVPGGFAPETDTLTFNGAMWLLARRNYFTDPDSIPSGNDPRYQAALAFYRQRAFPDAFRWSWKDARLEMDVYRQTIHDSDNAYRAATNFLGAILANHLSSFVDEFIMARLGRGGVMPHVQVLGDPSSTLLLVWEHPF
jgi:hypothetical protein